MRKRMEKSKNLIYEESVKLTTSQSYRNLRSKIGIVRVIVTTLLFTMLLTTTIFADSPIDPLFDLFNKILDPTWLFVEGTIGKVFAVSCAITCMGLILFPNQRKALMASEKLKYIIVAFIGFVCIGAIMKMVTDMGAENGTMYVP